MSNFKTLSGAWGGDAKISGPIIPDKMPVVIQMAAVIADIEGHVMGEMTAEASFKGNHYKESGIDIRGKRQGLSVYFTHGNGARFSGIVSSSFNQISGIVTFTQNDESISGPFVFHRRDGSSHASEKVIQEECGLA